MASDALKRAALWFEPDGDGLIQLVDLVSDAQVALPMIRLFHDTALPRFALTFDDPAARRALEGPRLERAIGVIYRPDTERASHYFTARLADQFDVVLHIDETHALQPLETWARDELDLPETYPSAL